jgi:ketosteroid isomerase-like protein
MQHIDVVVRFMDAINTRDVGALSELMTEDHEFTDSLGNRVVGRAAMVAGWRGYFQMCPDYWIKCDHTFADATHVAAFGAAGGTIDGAVWEVPASWLAVVEGERLKQWRVFADNKPVYDILARRAVKQ